jgi:predicted homoserine dehydrogenase-like protein
MMNSEADLAFGPYLMGLAEKNQLIYTSCDGDQHGVLARLIDEITLWGFDLIVAGNIKGFLDPSANPTTIIPEADQRNLDYKMATAYTDGTKLAIEMALLANGYNLRTSHFGMKGPKAKHVQEALHLFDLDQIWKSQQPVVDYLLGAEPGGGVFVIGRSDNAYQQAMMRYYKMGNGPYYLFYRPYHLCHIESMKCIFEAVRDRRPLLSPKFGECTNVYTVAKRDLKQGEILDGIGGYCSYGVLGNKEEALLPIWLSEGLQLKRDIAVGEKIYREDIVDASWNHCHVPLLVRN